MARPPAGRIATLDFIRGIAILGILAVNIAGFAGPIAASITPHWNGPASWGDQLAFAAVLVLFEGKMRALLSLLFGAAMLLFLEAAQAKGRNGPALQMRRLSWLLVIGYLHFAVLWWGDILFTYAFAGFFALVLRHLPTKSLIPAALLAFGSLHAAGMIASIDPVLAESRFEAGMSVPAERAALLAERQDAARDTAAEVAREKGGYKALVHHKLTEDAGLPLTIALNSIGETLPLMLLGMALFRSGFFTGGWSRRRLVVMAVCGIGIGGLMTLGLTGLAWSQGFPPTLTSAMLAFWLAVPHLAMALGYSAALVLFCQRSFDGRLAQAISTAGRMALSNYLLCSLVMTGLFYGWGLNLMGAMPERWFWAFIIGGWVMMLLFSRWWLGRYSQGPVEYLWRSLTEWRLGAFKL